MTTTYQRADYLSTADTAKLIRIALRDAFPGVRFSVRSSVYSGGSSIRVHYTDGPSRRDVQDVVDGFAGRDFDGSIDLATYVDAVLDARGRIVGRKTPGTAGSGGYISAVDDPVPPGGKVVHFGASYVFVDQDLSPDVAARSDAILRGLGYAPDTYAGFPPAHLRDWSIAQAIAGRDAATADYASSSR